MRFEKFNENNDRLAENETNEASIERAFDMTEAVRSEAVALGKFNGEAGRFARTLMLVSALSSVSAERVEEHDRQDTGAAWSSLENADRLLKNL